MRIALVLAGGQGRRIGGDKPLVRLPDGQRLIDRAVELGRTVARGGPVVVAVGAPDDPDPVRVAWGLPADVHVVTDREADAGPLAGLDAAWAARDSWASSSRPRSSAAATDRDPAADPGDSAALASAPGSSVAPDAAPASASAAGRWTGRLWVVLPCDMPWLDAGDLEPLIDAVAHDATATKGCGAAWTIGGDPDAPPPADAGPRDRPLPCVFDDAAMARVAVHLAAGRRSVFRLLRACRTRWCRADAVRATRLGNVNRLEDLHASPPRTPSPGTE